jgi:predicted NAD/FAD-dependent oxidoreductase
MIDKYDGWTQGTPETVDWLAYTKAQRKVSWTQFSKVIKLSNDWAATARHLNKLAEHEAKHYRSCSAEEDGVHVMQCRSRHEIR